ncbi:hypothetical protein OQJ46_09970 [Microbulbifer thermotolerans]|uniref:hypothetical protein n=1 Tax=Microbulbifer thermotolerans TaxID=252514 RepID=UPI00224B269C|nr:hypothetical protein [Microbulbifer thermotolerans]MCX2783314.1 hypothetical protein [Microbulbifer thermotolerans]MCX2834081.1 hypothetical protein [Microbulbifer thermotolerans]MCX2843196.1 hypothetical protein [Microbulbifer thermotolerans]
MKNKNFDPVAVCFSTRIAVEKLCYNLLPQKKQKTDFLATKKTRNKMNFATKKGVDIPESYFLLGLIYNTNLHWNQGRDYVSPLSAKLNHPTIRQLISSLAELAYNKGT